MTPQEQQQLQQNQTAWKATTDPAEQERLHNANEAIRNRNGFSGGDDGSKFLPSSGSPQNIPQRGNLRTASDLARQYGGITYDEGTIRSKFDAATKAQYDLQRKQYGAAENAYYANMNNTQASTIDAIRKSNAAAVATGASRGVQAANELSAILNMQQTAAPEATKLAQDRIALADKEGAAYAENAVNAMTTANQAKMGLGNLGANLYASDTQFDVGQLQYYASLDAANKNLQGQQLNADANRYGADQNLAGTQYASDNNLRGQQYTADKNLTGVQYNADKNYAGTTYTADKNFAGTQYAADKNFEGTQYNADKNYAGTTYTADKNYAGTQYLANANIKAAAAGRPVYSSGGGGGSSSGGNSTPSAVQTNVANAKEIQTGYNQAYASGDKESAAAYWVQMNGGSLQDAYNALDSDPNFLTAAQKQAKSREQHRKS